MTLKPLGNKVILQQKKAEEKTKSGIILTDSAKEKPQEAIVIAVGPGEQKDGKTIPMPVKAGEHVICSKYAGTTVKLDNEEYMIVSAADIIAKVEE